MTFEQILFYVLAAMSVGSALIMITRRSPVISALWLIVNFFALAALYLTLHAQFIAVIQVIVYAGAIMVLFLFVIMLLNLADEKKLKEKISYRKIVAVGLSIGVLMELLTIIGFSNISFPEQNVEQAVHVGTVENIGRELFTTFLFPFEITSVLLLAAIVGAVLLAKKNID